MIGAADRDLTAEGAIPPCPHRTEEMRNVTSLRVKLGLLAVSCTAIGALIVLRLFVRLLCSMGEALPY
jgi:hypothetical protein